MSDYVYEGGLSTQRRRQRRTAITLLLTALLLFGAFWWAWSYIRDGEPTATPTGTPTRCDGVADPRDITINVYNATSINGLASRVSAELTERGFTVGAVGNDPLNGDIVATAELRYGDAGRPFAGILKTIVTEPSLRPDVRTDNSVDFVLGTGYDDLLPAPAGLPAC